MGEDPSLQQLLAEYREGREDAARKLVQRLAHRLIPLARKHLTGRIRQKVDAEDVVQSVFKSFFGRLDDGEFVLPSWNSLWSLLVVITLRKCGRQIEYYRRSVRNIGREVASPVLTADSPEGWEALARDPSPAEAVMLAEMVEQAMRPLKERERLMFEMHLQGYTSIEISNQVERSQYTVNGVLKRIEKHLHRLGVATEET
jgi:RNA polymerase sigma-70 factor (ECF subfamily)